jgi:hypothetical protein
VKKPHLFLARTDLVARAKDGRRPGSGVTDVEIENAAVTEKADVGLYCPGWRAGLGEFNETL